MLVGDVRWAMPFGGSSWKLSGGRWLSTGADERLEEPPGPAGDDAEEYVVLAPTAAAAAARVGRLSHHADRRARPATARRTGSSDRAARPAATSATHEHGDDRRDAAATHIDA